MISDAVLWINMIILPGAPYLDLEEVLWWTVDFLKGLVSGVWHCLHDGGIEVGGFARLAVTVGQLVLWRSCADGWKICTVTEGE